MNLRPCSPPRQRLISKAPTVLAMRAAVVDPELGVRHRDRSGSLSRRPSPMMLTMELPDVDVALRGRSLAAADRLGAGGRRAGVGARRACAVGDRRRRDTRSRRIREGCCSCRPGAAVGCARRCARRAAARRRLRRVHARLHRRRGGRAVRTVAFVDPPHPRRGHVIVRGPGPRPASTAVRETVLRHSRICRRRLNQTAACGRAARVRPEKRHPPTNVPSSAR